jgi:hypothetical protein
MDRREPWMLVLVLVWAEGHLRLSCLPHDPSSPAAAAHIAPVSRTLISFVDDVKSKLPLVVVAVVYNYGKEQYSTVLLHINDTIIR